MEKATPHAELLERFRRFERLGGVDLSRLEPEERQEKVSRVLVGLEPLKKAVLRFRCPACGNEVENDQEMEPACTGPGTADEHPLEVMVPTERN